MELSHVVELLCSVLAPALPGFLGLGQRAVEGAAGEAGRELAERMWKKLSPKVEAKEAAREAARDLAEEPGEADAAASFRRQLKKILAGDALLAAELAELLQGVGPPDRKQAQTTGSGAVAQGTRAQAAGERAIVAGSVRGSEISTGDHLHLHLNADGSPEKEAEVDARVRYLTRARREWQVVPVAALGGEEGAGDEVTLDQVYVDLDTTSRLAYEGQEAVEHRHLVGSDEDPSGTRPLSALEAVERERRLVLLGEAGSGKSTFTRVVLSRLAAAGLNPQREPPPGVDRSLLPIFLICRDLSSALSDLELGDLSAPKRQEALACVVREQVKAELERHEAGDLVPELEAAWESGRCFLVVDGLDEVPEAMRERVRKAVGAVCQSSGGSARLERVIVTCRVRSYVGPSVLPGFVSHTLAPFEEDKVQSFCEAWYQAQRQLGRVDEKKATAKSEDLAQAALGGDLRELSQNPMLLTTLALVHQREVRLPDHRVELYEVAIGVLTEKWQRSKAGDRLVPSEALSHVLKDRGQVGRILQRLAVEAMRVGGSNQEEKAGLPRGEILTLLESPDYLGTTALAAEFLDYVDQRAGLLIGRGGEPGQHRSYGFPHRTFQEYLAGRWLVSQWHPERKVYAKAAEGDLWTLAVELGAESLLWVDRQEKSLLGLAYELGRSPERDSVQWRRAVLWSGKMSALVGEEALERDRGGPVEGRDYLEVMRPRLVGLLASDLAPRERAEAGRALGTLGDPRPEVTLEGMELCWVPAGRFYMGSEKTETGKLALETLGGEVEIPYGYWIGRHPVTMAQFRRYVEDSGANVGDVPRRWGERAEPVVAVSWHEARAFCRWLTDHWRTTGVLSAGWSVALPSEPEWEKAARGGKEVPREPVVGRPGDLLGEHPGLRMRRNPAPRRRWPWGEKFGANRVNSRDSGVGRVSVAGCFSRGASPYGCEDLAGNVWEWTRSVFKEYPYRHDDGREDPEVEGPRVLRGGSFLNFQRGVRCAVRDGGEPGVRDGGIGFRVVVSPFSSGL